MFFLNENDFEFVKCSAEKKAEGFIAIDDSLCEYVSNLFGKRRYGSVSISKDFIETIKLANEEIAKIRNEAEKKIETTIEELNMETLVSNQIEENKKAKDEAYNRLETQGDSFILFKKSEKTKKVYAYKVIKFDNVLDVFIVKKADSAATKRNPRTLKINKNACLNADKVILAMREKEIAKLEERLSEIKNVA